MRQTLFYTILLCGFLAALWLKFFAHGWLRGNVYDILLVVVVASATFTNLNLKLIKTIAAGTSGGPLRRSQIALNKKVVGAWAAIACVAELIQGVMEMATGKPALGTFDPVDLASYLAGAMLSFFLNSLLYGGKEE